MDDFTFVYEDPDFYVPLGDGAATAARQRWSVGGMPTTWQSKDGGLWTFWTPPTGMVEVTQGWKIHVSAALGATQHVLSTVGRTAVRHAVSFKHLSGPVAFGAMHHKHAGRAQAGKFCVLYPADIPGAEALMAELADELADQDGPHILGDRRFGASRVVHYRYGGYRSRPRTQLDGTYVELITDGRGVDVEDVRGHSFSMPAGVTDPFLTERTSSTGAELDFGGFRFEEAIRHSNGGGTYRGVELRTGRPVFIKEARADNGLINSSTAQERLRAEHAILESLAETCPGLAPEPIAYFREWEHEFLVTEFLDGESLPAWRVAAHPLINSHRREDEVADYFERCQRLITTLSDDLDRLHDAGYVFMDLNPNNVLVTANGRPRLVDFESVTRIDTVAPNVFGAPGFMPPPELVGDDLLIYDSYGLSALALSLLAPLIDVVRRNPETLRMLEAVLLEEGQKPALWDLATRHHRLPQRASRPWLSPVHLRSNPEGVLTALRDDLRAGILAVTDPAAGRPVPLGPRAHRTNPLSFAHGLAGVVHVLRRTGPVPDGLVDRLCAEAMARTEELPPGLHVGLAGIAAVLADCDRLDEARLLLASADSHPLLDVSASLAYGRAGVAQAHLRLYGLTGETAHLEQAERLVDIGDDAEDRLLPNGGVGLLHGRAGLALVEHALGRLTGDRRHDRRASRLLRADLDQGQPGGGGILFPCSRRDRRLVPYLEKGTAGIMVVAARLTAAGCEEFREPTARLLASLDIPLTWYGGLYQGMSGLAFGLAELASLGLAETSSQARQLCYRVASRLPLHAVPTSAGALTLGEFNQRFSCDLWNGAAGMLLAVQQVVAGGTDMFLTADAATSSTPRLARAS